MDAVAAYSFGSLAWLGCQAIPLIIWPTFISSILSEDYERADVAEQYFARSLGFSELTIGLMLVVLSGAVPLGSVVDTPQDVVSPYASAVVFISMFHHVTQAFYTYARYNSSGQTGYMLGCIGSTALACYALWILLFANDKGRISKRNGSDKRTSGWPFKNVEADKRFQGKKSL